MVVVRVRDDTPVQTQSGWEMFRGDSVELWLDTDLAGDFDTREGNADDWQFGFSPGNFQNLPILQHTPTSIILRCTLQ